MTSGQVGGRAVVERSAHLAVVFLSCAQACIPADRADALSAIPFGGSTTVYDVHTGAVDSSDAVDLHGVVANTPRRAGDTALLVQDPAGGAFGGIELVLHHPLPGVRVATADTLSVKGRIGSRDGRTVLVVEAADGITVTGSATATPTPVTTVADWEPLHGVLVQVDTLEVLDCGGPDGRPATDAGLALELVDLDRLDDTHAPVDVGPGRLEDVLGVVAGSSGSWQLRPRSIDDLPSLSESACPRTIEDALMAAVFTRTALDRAVVTAVHQHGDTPRAFLQDPSGGPSRGLELRSTEALSLSVGEAVQVVGLLSEEGDRPVLWMDGWQPHPDPDESLPVATIYDDRIALADWQGVLVSWPGLLLLDATDTGEVQTDAGVWLSPRLLPADSPLPTHASGDVTGILVLPSIDSAPLLMPRTAADWRLD